MELEKCNKSCLILFSISFFALIILGYYKLFISLQATIVFVGIEIKS